MSALAALDLARAATLHGEAFAPVGERGWTRQELAELLATPGVAGQLLQAGDRDVGFALHRVVADEAELLTIAVRPALRRRGAGRRLLDAVIAQVREAGARSLFLEVAVDNQAARRLYETTGFQIVGVRAGYYRRSDCGAADGLVMRLTLNDQLPPRRMVTT
ncbi:MAG: ribosomal protein S18-alanine N-acetyltransferase [Reyranella sp.]|uniref:ribosomal protein S18-alanine N-acetyltransferase n=1 Tax=Reyranella sp. TaxID=1929291 RepID=UPI003D117B25